MLHRNFPITCRFKKKHKFSSPVFYFISSQLPQWPGPVCLSPPSCQSLSFTCIHTVAFSGEKWECFAMLHDQSVDHASFKIHVEVSEQNFKTSSPRCRQRRGQLAKWDVKKTPCMNTGICGNKILTKITRKQKGARMGIEKIACTLRSVSFTKSSVWSEKN